MIFLHPTPIGRMQFSTSPVTFSRGLKVRAHNFTGVVHANSSRCNTACGNLLKCVENVDFQEFHNRYLAFSVGGIGFPVGGALFHAGHGHTLIFDPFSSCVRDLSLDEFLFLHGGSCIRC